MRILVTGGAGYVGSHCVRELCSNGYDVLVIDDLSAGHRSAVDARARLIVADLADREALEAALDGVEAVMHFAGSLNVGESVEVPLAYYRNNVTNTLGLLELMKIRGVRNLVFSSTCAVYGLPPRTPITEEMPREPISPYGRSKLAIEWALEDCAAAWGLSATALRYFNAAGASSDGGIGEDYHPEHHLIPLVLDVALGRREHIAIFGCDYPTRDGTCVRDYIHVEDLATAHRAALESQPPAVMRAFNLGTGYGVTVRELIETARQVTGHAIPAVEAARRPGDPPELVADASRARQALGWSPQFTEIEQIIETAWRWHRAHPGGFVE